AGVMVSIWRWFWSPGSPRRCCATANSHSSRQATGVTPLSTCPPCRWAVPSPAPRYTADQLCRSVSYWPRPRPGFLSPSTTGDHVTSDTEQRTGDLAYRVWESEGRAEGEEERHWEMATGLLHSEQQGELQPAPKRKAAPRKPRSNAGTVPADETQ